MPRTITRTCAAFRAGWRQGNKPLTVENIVAAASFGAAAAWLLLFFLWHDD
jgi:hypothetical protein